MINFSPLQGDELEIIVEAHMRTWSKSDLSVQLGEKFVRQFYILAMSDPHTLALGVRTKVGGKPVGWCIGFRGYSAFNKKLRQKMGFGLHLLTISRIISGRLSILKILDWFWRDKPEQRAQCPENHLGAFGCFENSLENVLLLSKLIAYTAGELCSDEDSCWAVTSEHNKGGRMVMARAGFKQIGAVIETKKKNIIYQYVAG